MVHRLISIVIYICLVPVPATAADVLQAIQQSGQIKIGYRLDAAPFSYQNEIGEPAGYTVDLCRTVTGLIGKRLQRRISVKFVPVTAHNRFDSVRAGKVDLLCGATTETISRRKLVQFSVATFVTGASVIYRADGPRTFDSLAGRVIGVTRGTTTEQDLAATLKKLSISAQILAVRNHDDGLIALQSGQVDAYFGDRAILMSMIRKSANSLQRLRVSDQYFSIETYALAMPRGNNRFRDQVDRALGHIYKSGGFKKIFVNAFGDAEPSDFLKALIVINALPE